MRKLLLVATALMLGCGGALAQSGQGGYLGSDPGAAGSAGAPAPRPSRQGGYLGIDPGAHQQSAQAPQGGDMRRSPTAWCVYSPEPDRCRGRAIDEDRICAKHEGPSYARCRAAMDQMYTH